MTAYAYETANDKAISGAAALIMHGLFLALLIFSVNWKKPEPAAMVAELWSNLPPLPSPNVEPPPPPPQAEPEPPKPRAELKPAPKAEPKPQPKADIQLRDKKEKERKAKEQAALEKKKLEERERAEAKRLAQEQEDALKKLAQQQASASAQSREIDKYKRAVAERIKRFITEPPNLQGNPEVEFEVIQLPGGEILGVKTRKASGQSPWDNAVERAILRAQPLPPPPDPAMFREVRELHLKFRPKE